MGAIQGYFATSGIGALIGGLLGWAVFSQAATEATDCLVRGAGLCQELGGMTFSQFILVTAATGGVAGFVVQLIKGEIG
ncbi:hypothetical protein [Kribbella sp. CA-293567]|uniref:hypothetical protein n=1 Tax=Kribbella sp. CA-293567 TaxID=3002436 RepID=UPI0022DD41D9|nr:hypothetical protein [Kribbella sp. CA-293567]WBQ02624.1 hypothetical protein OX958_21860 [Kribbella sp. CA-293567]